MAARTTYSGDLVGGGVLDDGDQALKLLRGELTGTLLQIDIGLLADKVGCFASQHGTFPETQVVRASDSESCRGLSLV